MKPTVSSSRLVRQSQETVKKKAFKHAQRRATETLGIHQKTHGPIPSIELFQKEDCPFSHAVRSELTRLGLDFVAHAVPDDLLQKHEPLVRTGGKDQVPFLIDHSSGVKLYESQAIIQYLDRTYGEPAPDLLGEIAKQLDRRVRGRADQIAWALKGPIERIRAVRANFRKAMKTLEGTYEFLRGRIERTAQEHPRSGRRMSERAEGAPPKAERRIPRRAAAVRVDIESVTEAA